MAKKKKKKKGKKTDGSDIALAGIAGGVVADVLRRVVTDSVVKYLNKDGKKKVQQLLKSLT